jgi:signal transduction histidine kinase
LRSVSPGLEDQVIQICGDRLGEVSLAVNLDPSLNPIVIELIRNAAEHSGASVINLHTKQDQALTVIEVSDNGTGGVEMKQNRFGLAGVTEAIAELSGQIEFINLTPGLLIRVSIPS